MTQKDYDAQLAVTKSKEDEYLKAKELFNQRLANGYYNANQAMLNIDADRLASMERVLTEEQELLDKKKTALDQSAADYGAYQQTINTYEEAQTAALEGNTQEQLSCLPRRVTPTQYTLTRWTTRPQKRWTR